MAGASGGKREEIVFTGLIWAYVGIIFGTVYIGLVRFFEHLAWPVLPEIPAAALCGAVGAVFYASMQLTVFAAMAGTLATFGYIILASGPVHPLEVLAVSAVGGLLVGALYANRVKTSRVYRADSKILAGLCAGIISSALLGLLFGLVGRPPVWATTLFLCGATGFLYALIAPGFIKRFHDLLPPAGDGALVGAGIAGFVGLMIWVVVADLHSQYTGPYTALADNVLERLPEAAGGAALGGALAGVVGALTGKAVQDL
jgi:hypothetical protein